MYDMLYGVVVTEKKAGSKALKISIDVKTFLFMGASTHKRIM